MVKRALISVSDKSGIIEFASSLIDLGYEILSTGGTSAILQESGISVTDVTDITDFPECFGGRVKTLHPMVAGGILFRRENEKDQEQAIKLGISPIDIVVVNLYPFEKIAAKGDATRAELIEQIDIGGPTLLRAAAKNSKDVTVVCDLADYDRVITATKDGGDSLNELRQELATKVFARTAAYDSIIARTLSGDHYFGDILMNKHELRYGENPHQEGSFYDVYGAPRCWKTIQQNGKAMSYLNILDADGAWNLVREFTDPTAACIKHANPSGVASNDSITEAFQRSYDADRLSAFGVIIALNRPCTAEIAQKIIDQKIFTEVIIAPEFDTEALAVLEKKPKIRAIQIDPDVCTPSHTSRSVLGGMLVQDQDNKKVTEDDLTCVTDCKPTSEQIQDLLFAWKVVKHAKSNAIVFTKDLATVGIGCGQTSRVDSTIIAARRAGDRAKGAVMASDAFFPFPDSVEEASANGIAAIIQPGGSIRDGEVIAKANELGIPMVLTGVRAFRH
ncbi:bifunctional phosphoribosylaminoimidazolecarboxamide formyltransferase/IMP cyclohydrolase [Candidatus Peregrinibacteria bacterium]|jgi:phosphoribosylaminoimidazolecarboxamide formyltransferase / IMP cyclohydrolase|nr:bifunctional phosphoribosylaminoimidazolecarboxamide formyltransferase/IMP cyclohydrolase [Candidatus Peregrinibacteria bacterium]MBT3598237.1 bifunctional phosphoribosylaminoimidazolecarboxamide formyltransferase/IMP cyclohydrolase [Candidatus Peregrinibacteria bacterium]MBT6730986.1 bifunctional phosphoribosylaminoimidazolecarboxamide formyltransferase/IMP cyclohydrolase [Candidatus Peregrinibacteria bacterium]